MISALLEACQEILNCQIMTVMENPLRSTTVLGSLRQRTTRSRLLPNLSSHQKQSESIFMQEHYFHFASSSSMSYTGLSIYDNLLFKKKKKVCAIYTISLHHERPPCNNSLHLQKNILNIRSQM
uniref:Uncharacterized protein n=1 Tax=Pseudonaja textilis TaxID=8673 RepID=A0A670Y613_PSETE